MRIKSKGASEPGKECGGTEKSHPQADNNGSLNLAGLESAATLRLARAVKDRSSGQSVSKQPSRDTCIHGYVHGYTAARFLGGIFKIKT